MERARRFIHARGVQRLSLIGAPFKASTNRLLGSPQIRLMERLFQDGLDILVYRTDDQNLKPSSSSESDDSSRCEISSPPVCSCLKQAIDFAELVVIGELNDDLLGHLPSFLYGKTVLDLTGYPAIEEISSRYFGVNWISERPVSVSRFAREGNREVHDCT